jgi:SAM-dependent methyltransferase
MLGGIRNRLAKGLLRMFPRVVPPAFTLPIYFERRKTPRNRIARLLYSAVAFNYDLVVVERVVEIPFVLQNLPPVAHARILDFGCTESPLPIHLASLGHRVTGVDLRPYPYAHPGFRFVHGDFIQAGFPSGEFDAVVAVSAIEHCGLGQYGETESVHDDAAIVREIHRVLEPGGRLLLTVPFGQPGQTSWYRVYDKARLDRLLASFVVKKIEYYIGENRRDWRPADEAEIARVDSVSPGFTQGVACVVAVKGS